MRMGTKWAWMSVSKPSVSDALGLRAAEQLTLNQWVPGSSPGGCTKENGLGRRKPTRNPG